MPIAAAVLLLAGSGVAALAEETPEKLDLRGTMARAREKAREVAAAEARQAGAEERIVQARAYRLPQLRFQELWVRTDSPAEAFAFQLNQERFSFADFVASDPNDPDALETAMSRFEAELPLYTGGELSARIGQAERAAEAARLTTSWTTDGAALAAAEAYVMLAQAREYGALLERARETVAAHVELARAYVGQGMLVESELLRAQVELARVEDLLATARGQARVAEANLAFRLAAPLGSKFELASLPEPPELSTDPESWLASAESRSDLEAARQMLAAGELEIEAQKAALKPRLGLLARHDWFDDSLFGTNGDSTTVMAVASIDLWTGGRRKAAVAAARAEAEAGARDVERFSEGVRLEVQQAFEEAMVARQRQATSRQALTAAAEVVRITEERFKSGVVKTIDLLDAVTARREAETRELVARAEAHVAALRLAAKAGRRPEEVLP